MTDTVKSSEKEFDEQRNLLFSEVGLSGSGYARYAAAMYFYKFNLVSIELLEIYRRCCKFDWEDPIDLALHEDIKTVSKPDLEYPEIFKS